MLVLSQRVLNCPIVSIQTGSPLGATVEAIIDPRQLIVVAFRCEGAGIDFDPAILHTSDIREWSTVGMIVNSSEDLMPPDDLVRLQEVLEFHFELIGKSVVDDQGRKVGRVGDYSLDTNSFYITQLHIKKPLLQSLNVAELLIARDQILDITDKKIIVKSGTVKKKAAAKAEPSAKPAFENPFRGTPQPESIKR